MKSKSSQRDRARDILSREVGVRTEAARQPAAHRARVSEHLLRRNVQPRLPDDLPPLQRPARHRLRTRSSCRRKQELQALLASGARIVTLESQTPVSDFDVFAFSVSFEWDYTNVLTLLRLAGMPLRAERARHALSARRHRRRGDVRQPRAAGAVCRRHCRRRRRGARARAGRGRRQLLVAPGTAADTRHQARLSTSRRSTTSSTPPTARIARFVPQRRHRCAAVVRKAALKTTEARRPAQRPPSSRPIPNSGRASSSKSCAAAPTCAASAGPATTTCRSARFRPSASSSSRSRRAPSRRRAGLVSIALCDHPDIEHILRSLKDMGYSISPASLRLDDLTPTIVSLLKESGERTLTIAPETGSDRLRRVINKTVTNEEILDRAELIFSTRHREPEALLHDRPPLRN